MTGGLTASPRRFLRSPALHFLLIGGLLFAAASWRHARDATRRNDTRAARAIEFTAAKVEELRRSWRARTGRLPEPAEQDALIEDAVDEQILFDEALARGLDRHDDVVERRLTELGGFLSNDPSADAQTLLAEAKRLGLLRSDLVVRRRLVEKMRLFASAGGTADPISDAQLRALLDRDPDRYRVPGSVTLTHVYLSRSRRGKAVDEDARRLLAHLRAGRVAPQRASALGDPFPQGSFVEAAPERELEKSFGEDFATAIASIEPGRWAGPISSAYGEHLVWVHERRAPAMPLFESVRPQLLERLREERAEQRLRAWLRQRRTQTVVRILSP